VIANENPRIAVLLPCYNEAEAIAGVVHGFRAVFPDAEIYVYDNNSIDETAHLAEVAGAIVRHESRQGKGHVVRRMFADVEADIYILSDGDGTYDAPTAGKMVEALRARQLDMVVGARENSSTDGRTYRAGHRLGNWIFNRLVAFLFDDGFTDIFSGCRVMSRRFVKSFPALAKGFEIEAQLTVHALELLLPCAEIRTPYYPRAEGASSKLRTYRDGFRILVAILLLFKEARPLTFFGIFAGLCVATSLGLGIPVVLEYAQTGLVPRFPTAILAMGLALLGATFVAVGLTLDTVSRNHRELKRLSYLKLDY